MNNFHHKNNYLGLYGNMKYCNFRKKYNFKKLPWPHKDKVKSPVIKRSFPFIFGIDKMILEI